MPSFFSEGDTPRQQDTQWKILQKILGSTISGGGGGGGGAEQIFSGHYAGGAPTDVPTTSAALAYDLDSPFTTWHWDGAWSA